MGFSEGTFVDISSGNSSPPNERWQSRILIIADTMYIYETMSRVYHMVQLVLGELTVIVVPKGLITRIATLFTPSNHSTNTCPR